MGGARDERVDRLARAFEGFTRRFKVAEAAAVADKALNPLDAQALLYVAENPGCGLGDVARFLGVAMSTMSSATDRLEAKGLVERGRGEGDRRALALCATSGGREVVEHHRAAYRELCEWMLARLGQEDSAALVRIAEKLANDGT
jgi:DNA-binding MarR family transcriptional regulator